MRAATAQASSTLDLMGGARVQLAAASKGRVFHDHLVLERISRDSADQRAGRAGRTAPGRAVRLWDERDIPALARRRKVDIGPCAASFILRRRPP